MSPELQAAVAAASDVTEGPAYRRGLLAIGPQEVNPSDVLARLIDAAKGTVPDGAHYAPSPEGQRKQKVTYRSREALRRKYAAHGIPEFLRELAS